MWQSGIDDGGIQDTDERTKDGRDQHPPFIVAACTPCECTCDPSSRHMKMGTHVFFLSPVSPLPSMIAKQERSCECSQRPPSHHPHPHYWRGRMIRWWTVPLSSGR